jgi:hypothetical protein
MVKTWPWRLLLLASVALVVAGIALLVMSLLAPAAESAALGATDGPMATHDPEASSVPGVAVHSGPGGAAAARPTPATRFASNLTVNLPPVATPALAASSGAAAQDP